MSLKEILDLLQGVLSFPTEIAALVNILKKTPEAQHSDIMGKIQKEAEVFDTTGRPSLWN